MHATVYEEVIVHDYEEEVSADHEAGVVNGRLGTRRW